MISITSYLIMLKQSELNSKIKCQLVYNLAG